jgi:hypothetical protein
MHSAVVWGATFLKKKSKKARPACLGPQVFGLDPTSEQLAQPGGPTGQRDGGHGANQQVCVERSSVLLSHAGLYASPNFPELPRWD